MEILSPSQHSRPTSSSSFSSRRKLRNTFFYYYYYFLFPLWHVLAFCLILNRRNAWLISPYSATWSIHFLLFLFYFFSSFGRRPVRECRCIFPLCNANNYYFSYIDVTSLQLFIQPQKSQNLFFFLGQNYLGIVLFAVRPSVCRQHWDRLILRRYRKWGYSIFNDLGCQALKHVGLITPIRTN